MSKQWPLRVAVLVMVMLKWLMLYVYSGNICLHDEDFIDHFQTV